MHDYKKDIIGKRVLITGGLGFIGSNLAIELLTKYKCSVIIVDDCSNSNESSLGEHLNDVELHHINVLDEDTFFPLLQDVNFIFHLACKQISSSSIEPHMHLEVNSKSTLNILEYIRKANLPKLEKLIYTGSTSIYGSSIKLPVSESDPIQVLSNYAATKLLGEHFCIIYNRNYGIPTTCLRYSNVYGPGQTPDNPYCGVIGKFIHCIENGKSIKVFGDGEQTRDYTYISDAVDATILLATHPKSLGDVFNVGTSVETSVNDLIGIISKYQESRKIEFLPERDIDNIRRRSIDIAKIHNKLGWNPNVNMRIGIQNTISWYKNKETKKGDPGTNS